MSDAAGAFQETASTEASMLLAGKYVEPTFGSFVNDSNLTIPAVFVNVTSVPIPTGQVTLYDRLLVLPSVIASASGAQGFTTKSQTITERVESAAIDG